MMAQTHIGYTGWQQPDRDVMPPVQRIEARRQIGTLSRHRRRCERRTPAPGPARFAERDGIVAIEAEHHVEAVGGTARLDHHPSSRQDALGRDDDVRHFAPVEHPGGSSPHLSYRGLARPRRPAGRARLRLAGPRRRGKNELRYAVSIDGGAPQIVNLLAGDNEAKWGRAVADDIRVGRSRIDVVSPGHHIVKLWLVDPNVVFQRLVLTRGPLPPLIWARRRAPGGSWRLSQWAPP